VSPRQALTIFSLLALSATALTQTVPQTVPQDAIRPSPQELKWRQIPWVLDLAEAARAARAENRPLFLWVTGDDPLERC
jgi:hypothetical protein